MEVLGISLNEVCSIDWMGRQERSHPELSCNWIVQKQERSSNLNERSLQVGDYVNPIIIL